MTPRILALIVETWWIASLVLWFLRGAFFVSALIAASLRPNLAHVLAMLSLAILCHVGSRGLWHLIRDTARRCR